jgi:hypothetical protein
VETEVTVLEERLTQLLAEDLGVPPETITQEFVQNWIEQHQDKETTFDFSGRYGGFNPVRKTVLTRTEIKENSNRAARFWGSRVSSASR